MHIHFLVNEVNYLKTHIFSAKLFIVQLSFPSLTEGGIKFSLVCFHILDLDLKYDLYIIHEAY